MNLPEVSILIPTYKRSQFFDLTFYNIKTQSYPHDKLTVIIDECKSDEPFFPWDISQLKSALYPIKLIYNVYEKRSSIGAKRNRLVKTATTPYIQFMDTDDIYRPDCIMYNYNLLKKNRVKCVGSDKMIFSYVRDNFKMCAIDCNNTIELIHEATLFFDRKWFKTTNKFSDSSRAEGGNFLSGMTNKLVHISDINRVMICLVHDDNTIDKQKFKENLIECLTEDEIKQLKYVLNNHYFTTEISQVK